jgi:hypothetical protein
MGSLEKQAWLHGVELLSGIVLAVDDPMVCGVWPLVLRALGK